MKQSKDVTIMSNFFMEVQAGSGLPGLVITDYGVIVTDKKGRLIGEFVSEEEAYEILEIRTEGMR